MNYKVDIFKKCLICNTAFSVEKSVHKRNNPPNNKKYCSPKCRSEAKSKQHKIHYEKNKEKIINRSKTHRLVHGRNLVQANKYAYNYRKSNAEKWKSIERKSYRKASETLSDSYVKTILANKGLHIKSFNHDTIAPFIELKRLSIKLKRALKQTQL